MGRRLDEVLSLTDQAAFVVLWCLNIFLYGAEVTVFFGRGGGGG